ncbi:hypothetical protein CJF32_00009253 [Rutstroemia sp. NJR-2017a WRK4]|nr:hypothetical protein CJF32_00009253 [Rutstroemia sp. NJR-2017a WRK4]
MAVPTKNEDFSNSINSEETDKMDIPITQNRNRTLVTTSYLLSNLHCPSCVSHIQTILYALNPRPVSVAPSLVSSWVTVQHDRNLSTKQIREALQSEGFDVCDVTSEENGGSVAKSHIEHDPDIGYLDQFLQRWRPCNSPPDRTTVIHVNRHLENCDICRQEAAEKRVQQKNLPLLSVAEQSRANGSSSHGNEGLVGESMSSTKSGPLVVIDSISSENGYRASLAIGGMTCASCTTTIVEELKKKPWIKNVVVNLISNSATVDFDGEDHKKDIVEAIEDIGYDASLDSVVDLRSLSQKEQKVLRTVEIMVEGMFCGHCPQRIKSSLETFGDRITIEKEISIEDPIMKISYIPQAPSFTIRHILAKISDIEQSFDASIYHPPTLEERSRMIHKREQTRLLARVIVTFITAIPTLIIGIIFMSLVSKSNPARKYLMEPLQAGVSRAQWALLVMATPVYFLCADVFHRRALKEVRSMWRPGSKTPILQRFYRFGSMNMLMSLGTSIAYFFSIAQLIAAAVHPEYIADENSFYFDSVVFLTLFLLVGRLIEAYSKSKTGDAVTMLGKLRPTEALLVESNVGESSTADDDRFTDEQVATGNGGEFIRSVNVDLLEFGDIIKVLHGGSPACDGTVIQGETRFDESSLTGESKLIKKTPGDEVFSGTVNKEFPVSVKITGVAGSSMLDQIVKAVREGQTRRAPMERIADTLTGYFVPFITLIAILTWIVWISLGVSGTLPIEYLGTNTGGWTAWSLQFAIAVFVVACPCGLALAAPTALFVGGGLAAQNGILVKGGGEAFEKASKLDCIVFDKTGTLTIGGEPTVTDSEFIPVDDILGSDPKKKILGMAKAVEANSSHTVAKAITSFCVSKEFHSLEAENIEEIPGHGMEATFTINSTPVSFIIGNEAMMEKHHVAIPSNSRTLIEEWKNAGKSIALAALSSMKDSSPKPHHLVLLLSISDPIRPEAPQIISSLRSRGTDIWMLSGDNYTTACSIGAQVGIPSSNIIAGVLPSQKADKISYLQKSLHSKPSTFSRTTRATVAMVGDGINDSPALTVADVGIAIGSGSDIAISSAEFVLVGSDLNALVTLLDLSKLVFRRIKFNFAWALVYNVIAVPIAAGVLYPLRSGGGEGTHIRLDPVWASLAMAASSVSVVVSSLALRSRVPGVGFRGGRER